MSIFRDATFRPEPSTPLYRQLYDYLRHAILSGQLAQGMKVPSTRVLADELGISRNTVLNAYEQLLAEGYLETIEGRGTFVTRVLPEQYLASGTRLPGRHKAAPTAHRISRRAQTVAAAPALSEPRSGRRPQQAFQTGMPALDHFPYEAWARLVARHAHRLLPDTLKYQDVAGYAPLREAIAHHVIVARQVRCAPEQIIIVSGSQGGLDLAARVLLDPGDAAWIEDPGYLGGRNALLAAGARLVPVPVDRDGLRVEAGIERAPRAHVAYLTPSHQFPLGVTLSLSRRLALLDWARHAGAYILEDDYDSEYRFAGRPVASLQGLDDAERVIYVGTFSKVLFPALRLGYLIVPPGLIDAFVAMRRATDTHAPILEQVALTEFIASGQFERHIRRMRTLYAERRAALLAESDPLPLELDAPEAGMHLVGWLPPGIDDRQAAERAAEHQVATLPLSKFALEPLARPGLILGYSGVDLPEIRDGARRLADALVELMPK